MFNRTLTERAAATGEESLALEAVWTALACDLMRI